MMKSEAKDNLETLKEWILGLLWNGIDQIMRFSSFHGNRQAARMGRLSNGWKVYAQLFEQ